MRDSGWGRFKDAEVRTAKARKPRKHQYALRFTIVILYSVHVLNCVRRSSHRFAWLVVSRHTSIGNTGTISPYWTTSGMTDAITRSMFANQYSDKAVGKERLRSLNKGSFPTKGPDRTRADVGSCTSSGRLVSCTASRGGGECTSCSCSRASPCLLWLSQGCNQEVLIMTTMPCSGLPASTSRSPGSSG